MLNGGWWMVERWLQEKKYGSLRPIGAVREDYHILQGSREEFFNGTWKGEQDGGGCIATIHTSPTPPLQPLRVATWRLQAFPWSVARGNTASASTSSTCATAKCSKWQTAIRCTSRWGAPPIHIAHLADTLLRWRVGAGGAVPEGGGGCGWVLRHVHGETGGRGAGVQLSHPLQSVEGREECVRGGQGVWRDKVQVSVQVAVGQGRRRGGAGGR